MYRIKNLLCTVFAIFVTTLGATAGSSATADFQINIPKYVHIQPVTSPILTANITDHTGSLHAPLSARFQVTSNIPETKLYLSANAVTESGYEPAMFSQGGQVYIAFTSLSKVPTSSSLLNCKTGALPKDSPGVVAYPVISVNGADNAYDNSKNKYEVTVNNGVSYVNVHVGSHVLKNSFASNDRKGFYQSVLSLTEADI